MPFLDYALLKLICDFYIASRNTIYEIRFTRYASRIYDFDGFRVDAFQVGELVSAELGVNHNGAVAVLLL